MGLPPTVFTLLLIGAVSSLTEAARLDERVEKLPKKYQVWLEEEVTYIIGDVERETFLKLETEQERELFIETFWRKRDPNPSTPENERREEHYKRLTYVNEFLGRDTSRPGWMTDRGRFHIILGKPVEVQGYEGLNEIYPSELWFYNDPELRLYGLPPYFYLLFFRRYGMGEMELYSPGLDGPQGLLTGYQTISSNYRQDVELAYNKLYEIDPEIAHASLSFRTDEGDVVEFRAPAYGTMSLLEQVSNAPFRGIDTSYAADFDSERGMVESDYLFSRAPSWGMVRILPGPGEAHYLHWVIEMDPQNVAVVKDPERGLYGTQFIISVEVVPRDDPDLLLINARKESFMNFPEGQLEVARRQPLAYSGMFPVAPGSYQARIVLRNRACPSTEEADCLKGYTMLEAPIEVPKRETGRPRLAEIVLAYGTERQRGEPAYRAFRFGSLEVLPNPRHVYAIGDPLVVMSEVLEARDGDALRFRVLNQERPGEVQLEKQVAAGGFRVEPLIQELSLEGLPGGRYRLVVDLLDAGGEVLETRDEPFDVTPRTVVARPGVRGSWTTRFHEVPGMIQMELGQQYLNIEQKDRARELLEEALAADPRLPAAREALASLMLEENHLERAIELLEPVRRFMPDRYEALVLLGEAHFRRGDYGRASQILEKAFSLRPLGSRLLNVLANSLHRLGQVDRSIELLERSLSREPDQPDTEELLNELKSSRKSSQKPER